MIRRFFLLPALALMFVATPTSALLVQPVFLDMRFTGIRSSAALQVVNDRNQPMAVEVTVNQVDVPESGPVVFTPIEGEDFLIFPSVANIAPNATQVFRVRWIGEPLSDARIFAFTSSELPVEQEAEGSAALQLLYAIQSVVAIGPANGRPDLSVSSVERATNAAGEGGIRVTFVNDGNLHGQVSDATLRLSSGAWNHTIDPGQMSAATGLGIIPANSRRTMFIKVEGVPTDGVLSIDADIRDER